MVATLEKSPIKGSPDRGPGGRFLKGHAPKSPGRPKGYHRIDGLLQEAIEKAQTRRAALKEPCLCVPITVTDQTQAWALSCQTLDEHFARRAFLNDKVLAVFANKRYPNLDPESGKAPRHVTLVYGHQIQSQTIVHQPVAPAEVLPVGNGGTRL